MIIFGSVHARRYWPHPHRSRWISNEEIVRIGVGPSQHCSSQTPGGWHPIVDLSPKAFEGTVMIVNLRPTDLPLDLPSSPTSE